MIDWDIKLFKDIAQFPPKVTLEKGKSYSFIPMEVLDGVTKYVSPKDEKVWTGSGGAKFENGDTLFARITPCLQNGKISQAKNLKDSKGFGSTEYFIFRGIKDVSDSDFIYYLSQTEDFRKYAIGSMVGASGRQRADATFVGQYEVYLPPLPTQKRIASILSAYDDLIENNLKRIKLLEELAQRTYEEWFVNRRIQNIPIEDKDFEIIPLREMVMEYMNGGWGKEEPEGNYIEDAYVLRGTDMPDLAQGNFSNLPLRFHTKNNLLPRTLVKGDISIEMSNGNINNIGRSFFYDGSIEKVLKKPVMCASFCKMLRPKNINFAYLIDLHLKYIQSNNSMFIYKAQAANGINNFKFEDMINEETIAVPKGKHLEIFINIIKENYTLNSNLKQQTSLLKESRDILLPRLMSGKIGVGGDVLGMVAEERENYN